MTDSTTDYLNNMPPQQALFVAIAFSDRMPTPYLAEIEKAIHRGALLDALSKTGETPLTAAILDGLGSPLAVKKLLDLGADATQTDANGWSPWAACQSRVTDRVVADEMRQIEALLLTAGIDPHHQAPAPEIAEDKPPEDPQQPLSEHDFPAKFSALIEHNTDGINCDLDTADIIKKLMDWDQRYGIEIGDVSHDGFWVQFARLPAGKDLDQFCQEIYEFCPDIIDQGFGCMDDMMEMMQEADVEIDAETQALIAGIDFTAEDFGLTLLARSLQASQTLTLWWD